MRFFLCLCVSVLVQSVRRSRRGGPRGKRQEEALPPPPAPVEVLWGNLFDCEKVDNEVSTWRAPFEQPKGGVQEVMDCMARSFSNFEVHRGFPQLSTALRICEFGMRKPLQPNLKRSTTASTAAPSGGGSMASLSSFPGGGGRSTLACSSGDLSSTFRDGEEEEEEVGVQRWGEVKRPLSVVVFREIVKKEFVKVAADLSAPLVSELATRFLSNEEEVAGLDYRASLMLMPHSIEGKLLGLWREVEPLLEDEESLWTPSELLFSLAKEGGLLETSDRWPQQLNEAKSYLGESRTSYPARMLAFLDGWHIFHDGEVEGERRSRLAIFSVLVLEPLLPFMLRKDRIVMTRELLRLAPMSRSFALLTRVASMVESLYPDDWEEILPSTGASGYFSALVRGVAQTSGLQEMPAEEKAEIVDLALFFGLSKSGMEDYLSSFSSDHEWPSDEEEFLQVYSQVAEGKVNGCRAVFGAAIDAEVEDLAGLTCSELFLPSSLEDAYFSLKANFQVSIFRDPLSSLDMFYDDHTFPYPQDVRLLRESLERDGMELRREDFMGIGNLISIANRRGPTMNAFFIMGKVEDFFDLDLRLHLKFRVFAVVLRQMLSGLLPQALSAFMRGGVASVWGARERRQMNAMASGVSFSRELQAALFQPEFHQRLELGTIGPFPLPGGEGHILSAEGPGNAIFSQPWVSEILRQALERSLAGRVFENAVVPLDYLLDFYTSMANMFSLPVDPLGEHGQMDHPLSLLFDVNRVRLSLAMDNLQDRLMDVTMNDLFAEYLLEPDFADHVSTEQRRGYIVFGRLLWELSFCRAPGQGLNGRDPRCLWVGSERISVPLAEQVLRVLSFPQGLAAQWMLEEGVPPLQVGAETFDDFESALRAVGRRLREGGIVEGEVLPAEFEHVERIAYLAGGVDQESDAGDAAIEIGRDEGWDVSLLID